MFEKRPKEPQSALAEAAGLRWLGAASLAVAEVLYADECVIRTRRIEQVRPSASAARQAGQALAAIHHAGAPAFGSPPAGWEGPNYIGTQRQACVPTERWAKFYVEQRVLPFAAKAADRGNLDDLALVERACDAILEAGSALEPAAVARIHGDLWAGNLIYGATGPVLIDPAAHGGHPLTDLAMLELFGAPYLAQIWEGYREATGAVRAAEIDQELVPVHQLHPVAVHAVTHGAAYGQHLLALAARTIEILG